MEYSYAFLILLLPFLSFVVLGLAGMKMKPAVAGWIGTVMLGVVFAMSVYTAYEYFFAVGRDATGMYPTVTVFNFTWLRFTELLTFNIGFRLTPISVMMLIVITTVSLMVHIYSFGYMAERDEHYHKEGYEKGFQRFYAFLSLFTMSMLGLVVATNIFQMYLFWELVGVCSYLLIGFYYPKHAAVHASKKAFIVTRFADLFFLIGILFYSYYVGTFSYDLHDMPELATNLAGATWIIPTALFLMFIGGAGKSAMFPLHIWLPDAMEGPTPVSALIHAATMVVAGVYQVCYAVDNHEGGLGYMAGMFHLFTHAMFKALLFLCSGSIIVIIGSNFKEYMGGLHKYMPITNICFLIGCLAIAGIPPFAGFWSKDEIITACFQLPGWEGQFFGWLLTVVAGMTAFYMFRLYYVIFWGQSYYELDPEHRRKPQEAPMVMCIPLIILAVISVFAGMIPFGHFVSATGMEYDIHINTRIAVTSVIVALIGIGLATYMYAPKKTPLADMLAKRMPRLHKAALNRFYIDDIWQFVTHKIIFNCFSKPIAWFDRHCVDGFMNFLAWSTQEGGQAIRPWQNGDVRSYAVWFLTGTVAITLILLAVAM